MANIVKAGKDLISFDQDKMDIIRGTIAKDLTPNEFDFFISVAKARGLDPMQNQIHAVKRNDSASGTQKMTIQVGIDGFRLVAARTGEYAGCDKTIFEYNNENLIISADVTVYRLVQGQRCGFTASADWSEFYPGDKMGFMWKAKPRTMLGKCAEAQALRKAFPNDLAGIYEPAEINEREVEPTPKGQNDDLFPNDDDDGNDDAANELAEQRRLAVEALYAKFRKLGVSEGAMMAKLKKPKDFDPLKITDDDIHKLNGFGSQIVNKKIPAREMFPPVNFAPKGFK
jgi:phage recombination protein Bet